MDQRTDGQLNNSVYANYCCLYDGNLVFEGENKNVGYVLGCDNGESVDGKNLFDFVIGSDVDRVKQEVRCQIENGGCIEFLIVTHCGRWILNRGVLRSVDGKTYIDGVLVVISRFKDIFYTQKQKLDEYEGKLVESNERASKDSLTMILNANTTKSFCEKYISGCCSGFALIVIDLDDFKKINDSYGHIIGDQVLIAFADIIKNLFRNNDIVGRIGGDEFLVLMKNVEDKAIVEKRSSQIVDSFAKISCCDIADGELSCSVGVAFVKNKGLHYYDVFRVADRAMYYAKEKGKNCYEVVDL